MEEYSCNEKLSFEKNVVRIALPVTLQSLLQSSFSVIDQVMIGQLGSSSIAGIGLGGKFASLYAVVLAAIASAAGIMISQYMGRKDEASAAKSFYVNLGFAVVLAAGFMALCVLFPQRIMAVYTQDEMTKALAVRYIRILAVSFLPMAVSSIVTTMLRCMEKAALPLYASMFALLLNTGLNYLLIFGKWNFPQMGVEGAALASTAAQTISCVVIVLFFYCRQEKNACAAICGRAPHRRSETISKTVFYNPLPAACLRISVESGGKCIYSNLWKYRNRCMRGDDHDHSCPDHCNRGAGGTGAGIGHFNRKIAWGEKGSAGVYRGEKTDVVRTGGIGAVVCVPCSCQPVLCKDL